MSEPTRTPSEPPRPDTTATMGGVPTPTPAAPTDATMTGGALSPAPLPSGTLTALGHYQIMEPIGRGGMGVVYKAYHPGLDRLYALKVMQATAQMPSDLFERFLREARAVAKIGKHPHIVQVHDVGQDGQNYYLAMDLVEGGSLDRTIAGKPMAGRAAADMAVRVAEALQVAHDAGIVHRDLKPSNILVSRDGVPQVTDFGLARDVATDQRISIEGQVLGTLQYMAPEQAAGEQAKVGPLSDVYGLGATIYEMLTGRTPFPPGNQFEVWAKVIESEPEPPRRVNPKVHPDIETICLKCMEKQPERRYASAGAVAQDLRRFLSGEPILATPPSGIQRVARALKRHRAAAIAAVLALFVGVGGIFSAVAWQTSQRRSAIENAWWKARSGEQEFDQEVARTPLPYLETHAKALAAIALFDRVLILDPTHAAARREKHSVAMKFGAVALAQRDFGLATTMFSAAAGLGVDDAAAAARLREVEEARGEEERRIRKGLHDLFDEFEKKKPSEDPGSGYLPDALQTAMEALALTGGSEVGARSLSEGCLEILRDAARSSESRVVAGTILAGIPRQGSNSYEVLSGALESEDLVLKVVAAHILAASRDPRWAGPLRAAWDRLAERGPRSPQERRLQIELGRALLIQGEASNVEAMAQACLPDAKTEFAKVMTDLAGTLNPRSVPFYLAALERGSSEMRLRVLDSLNENENVGLLKDSLLQILLAREDLDQRSQVHTESTFTLDALFASPMFQHMVSARCSPAPWQVARLLVGCGASRELQRALDAPRAWCRSVAAIGLGELRPLDDGISAIRSRLKDDDAWVRACAAVALARNGVEDGLAAVEAGVREGDEDIRAIVTDLREQSPGFESRGTVRELFATLGRQLPPGPPPNAFLVYGALGESGSAHYMRDADWGNLPVTLALLGRVPLTLRASSLRSDTADRALEEALEAAPRPIRVQQVLRLMGLHRHPRAAEHARRHLSDPSYFVQVEALRTLITIHDPEAPAALARLREAWWRDTDVLGRLRAEVRLKSPTAVASSAGLYQEILQPLLIRMGEIATPEAAQELLEWMDEKWLMQCCFEAFDRMGARGPGALRGATRSPGKAAYARGWISFIVLHDHTAAREAFEEAVREEYGKGRSHLALGWLDMTDRGDVQSARRHFIEARAAGGGPVTDEATLWLGVLDFFRLHDPLEAEACWRDILAHDKAVPDPVASLPTLPPRAPNDAQGSAWTEAGHATPFLEYGASTEARGYLGYLLAVERGEVEEGWKELVEAFSRIPDQSHLLPRICELVLQHLDGKVYPQIVALNEKYPCSDPTWPVWTAVAPALAGKPQESVAALDRMVDQDAIAATARWALAEVELRRGRPEAARKWIGRAIELEPSNPRWRRDLSALLLSAGDLDGAAREARIAAMADPWLSFGEGQTAEVWLRRAIGSLAAGAPTDAEALARRRQTLKGLLGPDLPQDPKSWAAWWGTRAATFAWDRGNGRFR